MAGPTFQSADAVYDVDAKALKLARLVAEPKTSESQTASLPPLAETLDEVIGADAPASLAPNVPGIDSSANVIAERFARQEVIGSPIEVGGDVGAPGEAEAMEPPNNASVANDREPLIGLAISGGGIRSATFALGVLQRLAMDGRLSKFDLLSTVSGGGYIGAFVSAWIKRNKGDADAVWRALAQCPENHQVEPPEVQWLRRYSNYLTPRVGALSLDALTVAATYVRNVLLNMAVLVGFVAACAAGTQLLAAGFKALLSWPIALLAIAVALGILSVVGSFAQLSPKTQARAPSLTRSVWVYGTVVGPTFLTAVFGSVLFPLFSRALQPNAKDTIWAEPAAWGWAWLGLSALIAGTLVVLQARAGTLALDPSVGSISSSKTATSATKPPNVSQFQWQVYVPSTVAATGIGFATIYALMKWLSPLLAEGAATFVFGGPTLLIAMGLSVTVWIGLMGRSYPEMYREWWSRVAGAVSMIASAWVVWSTLVLIIPGEVHGWGLWLHGWGQRAVGAVTLGSLISALGLIQSISGRATPSKTLVPLATLAAVLSSVVLFLLIAIIDWGVYASITTENTTSIISAAGVCAAAVLTTLVLGWRVDINRFSLHDMYKNRLIRCYLGASNPNRNPNPFTGFDADDDIALADLAPIPESTAAADDAPLPLLPIPQRPFHIFNAALNLVHGSELAWQERKSALFVLTPTYCGYNLSPASGDRHLIPSPTAPKSSPGSASSADEIAFRPTQLYADNASAHLQTKYTTTGVGSNLPTSLDNGGHDGFTLGMAMATSGAAVSPNMGANTQPALAMLMTVFNIRLGRWCPNPSKKDWRRASPRSNLAWLLAEATGNTNERSGFVYLSDGGHFENTAVYELIRRRCSHIVMVDAGADPERSFEDLGNLIRKARVDLGAEISLNLDALYALKTGRSAAGFVNGTVNYEKGSKHATGKILLLKPTLDKAQSEPADIYNYARRDAAFPQQTTLDQWFDESQFEAYRCLGSFIAKAAFESQADFLE